MTLTDRQEEAAKRLFREGRSVRDIAGQLHCSRQEVQKIAGQQSRRATFRLAGIFLVFAAGFGVMAWFAKRPASQSVSSRPAASTSPPRTLSPMGQNIMAVIDVVRRRAVKDRWLLDSDTPQDGVAAKREFDVLSNLTGQLERALEHNSPIPKVAELKKRFGGRIVPTVFSNGTSRFVVKDEQRDRSLEKMSAGGIEVVFYTKSGVDHPRIKGKHLFYDSGWRSCFMAMLEYPDRVWRDAGFIHELWHAKKDRDGATSAHALQLSDEWVSEELEAHDLETDVLDLGTQGAYRKKLQDIATASSAASVQDFLASVSPVKVQELEDLFAPATGSQVEVRSSQYVYNLGRVWLDLHQKGEEREKIAFYRLIAQPTVAR